MMLEAYLSREDMVLWYECGDFPFNFAFMAFGEGVKADEVSQDRWNSDVIHNTKYFARQNKLWPIL